MRNVVIAIGLVFWCLGAFLATFWLTFPSDELGERIRLEVPERLGAEYTADLTSVSPWWLGVSVRDLKLYRRSFEGGEELSVPAAIFDRVRIAVSPWSLVRRSPYFKGSLDFVDGSLAYQVGTTNGGRSGTQVSDLVVSSDQVPLGDLLAISDAVTASVVGNVALALDIHGGENGMRDGTGSFSLSGEGLTVSDVEIPNQGPLGMDVPVDRVDIAGEVTEGKLELSRGILASPLFTVEVKGSILLRDQLERSTADLELTVTNLGSELSAFEGMLSSMKGSDGAYHFYCRGPLDRLATGCSGTKPAISSRGTTDRLPTARRSAYGGLPGADDGEGASEEGGGAPIGSPQSADERRKRREERREELRKRREERLKAATGAPTDDGPDDGDPASGSPVTPDDEFDEVPEDAEIDFNDDDELPE